MTVAVERLQCLVRAFAEESSGSKNRAKIFQLFRQMHAIMVIWLHRFGTTELKEKRKITNKKRIHTSQNPTRQSSGNFAPLTTPERVIDGGNKSSSAIASLRKFASSFICIQGVCRLDSGSDSSSSSSSSLTCISHTIGIWW